MRHYTSSIAERQRSEGTLRHFAVYFLGWLIPIWHHAGIKRQLEFWDDQFPGTQAESSAVDSKPSVKIVKPTAEMPHVIEDLKAIFGKRVTPDGVKPMAAQLLLSGSFPLTCRSLLSELDELPKPLSARQSFVVADGGQIHWSPDTQGVNRDIRFAISSSNDEGEIVLVSTGTRFDSSSQFLQVLAWDTENEVFNYYERRSGTWIWAGNSYHALEVPTRGKGPFDSHVNGSLVMKELKLPWTHWHSQSSTITDDVLAPDDPLRDEPLWQTKSGAEDFETSIVRPGIRKWTSVRVNNAISSDGVISSPRQLLRHLFESTTVNLIASDRQSRSVATDTAVKLPLSFFLNSDMLFDQLGLEPDIKIPTVSGEFYLSNLANFEFKLQTEGFERVGDTHFAFIVPEPASEDNQIITELLRQTIVTPRFVACVLMVDFVNPVSSSQRGRLWNHVPGSVQRQNGAFDFESQYVQNIEASLSGIDDPGPANQFIANWELGDDWKPAFEQRVEAYFASIQQKLQTQSGYDDYVRLAESRRREFRRRPLAEFDFTLPVTNIPNDAPSLQMFEDGSVGAAEGD